MMRTQVLPEEVYLDPDEEDDLMADDVRDEDYYAARAVPRDPKKKKKKKKDKKERPTKPRLVLHWGREKLVETDVFISHADLYAKALTMVRFNEEENALPILDRFRKAKPRDLEGNLLWLHIATKLEHNADEVIADTALDGGFLPTCKKFEQYIQTRFKTV